MGRRFESEAPHWRPRELPFYAADDTRLHWAIFARCMVSKGLTGGAQEGRSSDLARHSRACAARAKRRPGMTTLESDLLRLLQLGRRISRRLLLGLEVHLVPDLHLLEHGGVLDLVDHRHRLIH